jgi:hypothetical protein
MKVFALAIGLAFVGLACSNPCDKLAKEVCAKANDQKACDAYKEKMKAAGAKVTKESCEKLLGALDKEVAKAKRWAGGTVMPPPPAPPAPPPPAPAPVAPTPEPGN